jgi:hypothetical protein
MTTRHATCNCGQLRLTIEGEPSRISMCHCLECQRRTGAVKPYFGRITHAPSPGNLSDLLDEQGRSEAAIDCLFG